MMRVARKLRCQNTHRDGPLSDAYSTTVKIKRVKPLINETCSKRKDAIDKIVLALHEVKQKDVNKFCCYNLAARDVLVTKVIEEVIVHAENGEWDVAIDVFVGGCSVDDLTNDISVNPLTFKILMDAVGDLPKFKKRLEGFLVTSSFREQN
jgi:hypothetical protein